MTKVKIQLDRRQKIVLALTLVALGFLVWQIVGLLGGNTAVPVASHKSSRVNTATTVSNSSQPTPEPAQLTSSSADHSGEALGKDQQQYLNISSQYELAKLQRRLLEEQVAISAARNRIADTEQRTNEINTANAQANPSSASSLYLSAPYRLSFLSRRGDQWTATIVVVGEFKTVLVGDTLVDGTKVIAIDQRGVVLEKNNQQQLLTFSGLKPVTNSE